MAVLSTAAVIFAVLVCFVPQLGNAGKFFVVEVCEIPGRAVIDLDVNGDPEPATAGGLPAYGNEFIVEGLLFPEGTLTVGEYCIDLTGEVVPEIADLVIGTWTCRGWHVGDGADSQAGPVVITTQNFDFYSNGGYAPGKHMIVTDGFELVEFDEPNTRPIVGASGRYRKGRHGESVQTLLDFMDDVGVKIRTEFSMGRTSRR